MSLQFAFQCAFHCVIQRYRGIPSTATQVECALRNARFTVLRIKINCTKPMSFRSKPPAIVDVSIFIDGSTNAIFTISKRAGVIRKELRGYFCFVLFIRRDGLCGDQVCKANKKNQCGKGLFHSSAGFGFMSRFYFFSSVRPCDFLCYRSM